MSRARSLGPWLVPATLAAALSAHAASRGDEALNDLPYFVGATARLRLDTYADPSLQVGPLWLAAIRVAGPALPWLVVAGGSALVAVTLVGASRRNTHVARCSPRPGRPSCSPSGCRPSRTRAATPPSCSSRCSGSTRTSTRGGAASTRAAVLIGASAGLETWGLLGLPLLLALAPRAALRAATAAVAVAAALYLPFVLGGDFRMAEYRWTVADGTPVSLLVHGEFPWGLRLAQGVLAVAVGAVILLVARRSVAGGVAAAGAVVAVRLLLDPERHGWYWIAPQLLAVALGVALLARLAEEVEGATEDVVDPTGAPAPAVADERGRLAPVPPHDADLTGVLDAGAGGSRRLLEGGRHGPRRHEHMRGDPGERPVLARQLEDV